MSNTQSIHAPSPRLGGLLAAVAVVGVMVGSLLSATTSDETVQIKPINTWRPAHFDENDDFDDDDDFVDDSEAARANNDGWQLRGSNIVWTENFVGVNVRNPSARFDVKGATRLRGHVTCNKNVYVLNRLGVGTTSPAVALHVNGTTRTNVIEIAGADLAEEFPFSTPQHELQPGMVVAIDPSPDSAPGTLTLSTGAYNRRVAGVIAGANAFSTGVVLGRGTGDAATAAAPVALAGRVYVWCDASSGAIEPGDMLTTSGRPGHAMRVDDFSRMHGAVIGKAMTALPEGEVGLVLVLVNLQ